MLNALKQAVLIDLSKKLTAFEVFDGTILQGYSAPSLTVKLSSGTLQQEISNRYRVTAKFTVNAFRNEREIGDLELIPKIASALSLIANQYRAQDVQWSFEDAYLAFQVTYSFVAVLTEQQEIKMNKLSEAVHIG